MNQKTKTQQWLVHSIAALLSFAFSLILAEQIYAYFEPAQQARLATRRSQFVTFDPVLGWKGRPNVEGISGTPNFRTKVSINADGLRDDPVMPKKGFRAAVLGDSLGWGWGVEHSQRFDTLLEKTLGIDILNFSVIAYSPVQFYLQLDKVLSYDPDLVILTFTLDNDFDVVTSLHEMYRPYALMKEGRLSIEGYPLPDYRQYKINPHVPSITRFALGRLFFNAMRVHYPATFNYLFNRTNTPPPPEQGILRFNNYTIYKNPNDPYVIRAGQALGGLLKATKDKLDAHHVPLLLLACDIADSVAHNEAYMKHLRSITEPLGIRVITTKEMGLTKREYFYPRDAHWNVQGHQVIGQKLAPYISQYMMDKRKTP